MKLDPQNEEHRVLIESIEETFALFFGQMAFVEAFSEMVDSFYAQMDEQVNELENIMHEVLEPLNALGRSMDEAIENFMRYFDAPESPIRQVEELLCGEDETTTRFGKVILEELDRDSARYHLDNNRYLDMDVTVSGFHIANSRDCDLLSDRIIEVMELVHILWEKGKIEGDRNIRVIINDLTVPITNIEVPQEPIEAEWKQPPESVHVTSASDALQNGTSLNKETRSVLSKNFLEGIYTAEGSRMNIWEKCGIDWSSKGKGQIKEGAYLDVRKNLNKELLQFTLANNITLTGNWKKDLKNEALQDFVTLGYMGIKIENAQKEGRSFEDAVKFGIGVYHGAYNRISSIQSILEDGEELHFKNIEKVLKSGSEEDKDLLKYINEIFNSR